MLVRPSRLRNCLVSDLANETVLEREQPSDARFRLRAARDHPLLLERHKRLVELGARFILQGHHLEDAEGDSERARDVYEEGLRIAAEVGDVLRRLELEFALGIWSARRGEWDAVARRRAEIETLAERESLGQRLCLSDTLGGVLQWRVGEFDLAIRTLCRARAAAERIGLPRVIYTALIALATAQRDARALGEAIETFSQARAFCVERGAVDSAARVRSDAHVGSSDGGRSDCVTAHATRRLSFPRAPLPRRPSRGLGIAERGRGLGPRSSTAGPSERSQRLMHEHR